MKLLLFDENLIDWLIVYLCIPVNMLPSHMRIVRGMFHSLRSWVEFEHNHAGGLVTRSEEFLNILKFLFYIFAEENMWNDKLPTSNVFMS